MLGAVESVQTLLEDFHPVRKTYLLKAIMVCFLLCTAIALMDEAELDMKLKKTENRKGPILGVQFEVCMSMYTCKLMNNVIEFHVLNSLQMSATTKHFHTSMKSRTGKKIMLFCTL